MAETSEEPRVAEAVSRLLARQSVLLARAADDEAAAGGARLGLSWLADLLRSFDLPGAGDWFAALRARGDELGGRTSAAWPLLAAPLCDVLAGEVRRTGSLAPLRALDWKARIAELTAFAEPLPLPEPLPAEPEPAPEPPALFEPEPEPVAETPLLHDDAHAALFEAIADFAGEDSPEVDALHGRVEITGLRRLPGGEMDAATDNLLGALDRAARAAESVLLADIEDGALAWRVRLPSPRGRHYLFVDIAQSAFAVPWSRVVEYGLIGGSEHPRVVLGSGLGRIDLAVDWLFGKGEGHPAAAPHATATPEVPEGFAPGAWVEDGDGRLARVLDLAPVGDAMAESTETPQPAPPETLDPPQPETREAVQPEEVRADNPGEPPVRALRARRALVADDSMMARVFLGRLLAQRGIEVDEAEDGPQAQAAIDAGSFDLVFLDAEMPGLGALEILARADSTLAARACVLVKDDEERRRAEGFGAVRILYKPFAEDDVRSAVDALLAHVPPGN